MGNTELTNSSVDQDEFAVGAGSKPSNVNKPDDDITTYIWTAGANFEDRYVHASLPVSGLLVQSVNLDSRGNRRGGSSGSKLLPRVHLGGNYTDGAEHSMTGAWEGFSDDGLAKPGGGSWSVADVNNSLTCVKNILSGATGIQVSTIQMNVDWAFLGGGFAYLIGQWLPPLLAVASHGLLRREVISILSRLRTRPSNKEDFACIFEAFRRRPVYGFHFGN